MSKHSNAGKGDKERPLSVNKKQFDNNWELAFGKKNKNKTKGKKNGIKTK